MMIRTTFPQNPDAARTPVRLPDRRPSGLFPGWGPKL